MGLGQFNQLNPKKKIIFLKKFTSELLANADRMKTKAGPTEEMQVERLKQKFLRPITPDKALKRAVSTSLFQRPVYIKGLQVPEIREDTSKKPLGVLDKRRPITRRIKIPRRMSQMRRTLASRTQPQPVQPTQIMQPMAQAQMVQPQAQKRPKGFALGRLEPLLKDNTVQSIECPGPSKNVLVKRYNKINITKIILNQQEITDIINDFAEKARIPIIGGILKAAVGDIVISAVISEFVGSRFIINKITPYSLIEK